MDETIKERLARKIIYYRTQNHSLNEDVEKLKDIVDYNDNRKKELVGALAITDRLISTLRQ